MNILFIAPGYPYEMPLFVRGLSEVGAQVFGIGDQPEGALPATARRHLSGYLHVDSLWNEPSVINAVRQQADRVHFDRVECLWEPGMLLAARLREELDLPGLNLEQTLPFRDKGRMKEVLDRAGLRTPRHRRETTAMGCREAAEDLGYPLAIKPISGAGSADTYRVDSLQDLDEILPRLTHVPEVSVEEFIEGEEYTFDTICHDGAVGYFNISWYRPQPLIGRTVEWISPQTVSLRDVDAEYLQTGRALGRAVLEALGFSTGFTHMEWFLTPSGEAVFGEIGARPPGARSVDIMNYAGDIDVYRGWAEAVCRQAFSQPIERRYNAAVIFKRARGSGKIRRIEGLERLLAHYGQHVVAVDCLPVGAHRRDWKQTLLSDGHVILRHPDLATTLEMADRVGTDLQLFAG